MLNAAANKFLIDYGRGFENYKQAAAKAKSLVESVLSEAGIEIVHISARAKTVSSIKLKLRRKNYSNPEKELTDKVGVRVITTYESDIEKVVDRFKRIFKINKENSVDKRTSLGIKEFGYRSVHLIVQLKGSWSKNPEYASLRNLWFEIQVRTILEHAWAVIDHEIIYKSGVNYSDFDLRRFASIAGALEILEREFYSLKSIRNQLIDKHKLTYQSDKELNKALDSARLLGLLEQVFPDGLSWRRAEESGASFPRYSEVSCLDALKSIKIKTGRSLIKAFKKRKFKAAIGRFAANASLAESEISHLAVIALVLGCYNRKILETFFDELSVDPSIINALR